MGHDLIGNSVIDNEGNPRGLIVEIHANPASDLLVLEDETLIPVVSSRMLKIRSLLILQKAYFKIENMNRYSYNFPL